MEQPLTIQLVTAREMLDKPETRAELIESLGRLSEFSIQNLSPLVFDLIFLARSAPIAQDLERMLQLRPEWVNQRAANLSTPLMEAVIDNHPDLVKILIGAGADTSPRNNAGSGVLDLLAHNLGPQPDLIGNLLASQTLTRKEKDRALYLAAYHGNLDLARSLLADGAGFDVVIEDETALSAAAATNEKRLPSLEIVRALLQHDAIKPLINEGWTNTGTMTPLHRAAEAGNTGIMKLLLEAGAQVNPPPKFKRRRPTTPLMSAAIGLQPKAMDILIKAGADATLVDISGLNVLHCLATFYAFQDESITNQDIIKSLDILVAAGAEPSQPDKKGRLPQDIAMLEEKTELAAMLAARVSARGLESTPNPVMTRSPSSRRL